MLRILLLLFFIFNSFIPEFSVCAQTSEPDLNVQEQIISDLIKSSVNYRDSLNVSVKVCDQAIKIAEREQVNPLLALALKTQGINYYYLRDFDSCLVYYSKALVKFEELGNMIQVGKILGNMGLVYLKKGKHDKTIEYYLREIEVFSKINYTKGLPPIYTNLGGLFVTLEEYEKAEDNFQKALVIADKNNNDGEKVDALNNLGVLYEYQNRLDEALSVYEESLDLVINSGNSVMRSKLYLNIGVIYKRIKDYDQASKFFEESFNIRKLRGNYEELLGVYNEMFELSLIKGRFINAKRILETMQDLAEMNADQKWIAEVFGRYTNFYKTVGDYKLALISFEKYTSYQDSINSIKNEIKYNQLLVMYEVDQTKQKIDSMIQETRIQSLRLDKKNAWLVAMIVIMLLGVIAIMVSFRINKLKAKHKLMSLDQKVLLSQMNPHFLFNALTAVQSLVLDNESDKANLYLSELGTLVRNVLEDSREEYISFRKELQTLEMYIDLQKLRFDFPLEFRFDIDECIDLDELHIPPMLTQPFIENALVHADLQQVENPVILIKLKFVDDHFVAFSIQDNGIGIQEGKKKSLMKEKKSLAMQIARDRIQIYNYKSKHQMKLDVVDLKHIDKDTQGTLARFTIPTQA